MSETEREAWRERWRALRAATLELEAVLERNGVSVTRLTEIEANNAKRLTTTAVKPTEEAP